MQLRCNAPPNATRNIPRCNRTGSPAASRRGRDAERNRLFLVAAEGVANSLDAADLEEGRVVPNPQRIREVSLNVATAVAWECQASGLARRHLGSTLDEVRSSLRASMWSPKIAAHL